MIPLSDPDAEQASNVVDFLGYKARLLRNDPTSDALIALSEAVAGRYGIRRVEKMLGEFCGEKSAVRDAIMHRLAKSHS